MWWVVVDPAVWGGVIDRRPSADLGVCFTQRGKGFRIVRPGLEGVKHRLGVWVVVAGMRPVQRAGHTMFGEEFTESFAGHRSTVLGVRRVHNRKKN